MVDQSDKGSVQLFSDSKNGNIKDIYSFQSKLAQGGFGIVYLAEHRQTKQQFAVKAIQKKKVKDYTTFINEINILKLLVSAREQLTMLRTTRTSSNCTKCGSGKASASWFLSTVQEVSSFTTS